MIFSLEFRFRWSETEVLKLPLHVARKRISQLIEEDNRRKADMENSQKSHQNISKPSIPGR
jgi:hypothetical protein